MWNKEKLVPWKIKIGQLQELEYVDYNLGFST